MKKIIIAILMLLTLTSCLSAGIGVGTGGIHGGIGIDTDGRLSGGIGF